MKPRLTTATATCNFCPWSLTYAGVNPLEGAEFLRSNLIAHVDQAHPNRGRDKGTILHDEHASPELVKQTVRGPE